MYKVADGLHEQERDVAKYWTNSNNERVGVCIAFLGFENQTKYDKDMPLRVIGYDGAEGRAEGFAEGQLEAIRSLMANMGMSAAQAMDALGICPDERETFEAMLAAK